MVTDGGISVAAISSGLNFGYRTVQTGYELKAVPQQTQKLLATIAACKRDIQYAKSLRVKKSGVLSEQEKAHIDEKIVDTEAALDGLEALVESARVDMMTKFGRVSSWNRTLWVVRDGPQVGTSLARLQVAMTALNEVVTVMSLREGDKMADEEHFYARTHRVSVFPPPNYKTSEFLHQKRILRHAISREGTNTSSGMEAWGDDQDTEIVPDMSALPNYVGPAAGIYELEGSHAHLPPPSWRATSPPTPDYLRARTTALQLFGSVGDTPQSQSHAARLHERVRSPVTDPYHSSSPMSGDRNETGNARTNNHRGPTWEVLSENAGNQTVQRPSWLAYRASLPS